MAPSTVFDVASALLSRAPRRTLGTVKLQKLCFYAFGWYAHQTGQPLFAERFWAMEKGPVVGELLSAHATQRKFSIRQLDDQFSERDMPRGALDAYMTAVVDAVWDYYGKFDDWQLVDLTHEESVWDDAWSGRPEDSRRGELPHAAIVDYFMDRSIRPEEKLRLPESRITVASEEWMEYLDRSPDVVSDDFVASISQYLRAHVA